MYRLDHLDVEDWLPRDTQDPEPVKRYQDAWIDWRIEVRDPWDKQLEIDADAFRKQTGVRPRTPESRAWYQERRSKQPVFVPPDSSMVKDYQDLP
jgi:hypothetical protein